MIIMNDDDENDNNERTTHPLASEIQGQPCQALKSTMGPRVCVCAHVYVFVSVWPSGCHCATDFTSKHCLFIYVFNYLPFSALWPLVLVSSRKPRLCVAILQSGGVALCLSCFCVRARWGGWCQRTLAEASVLKCNDTWFSLIHSHVHAWVHMYAHNCGN